MAFFIHSAPLQIGPLRYSMNDGSYFEFEVPFHDSEQLTTASFTVSNLNTTSRTGIQKDQVVIPNAGYEDDVDALFVGQVTDCSHRQDGVEWQTKTTTTTALDQWLNSVINKAYVEGSRTKDIVRDLLNISGLEVGVFQLVKNTPYPRGRVCSGKLKDILTEVVINECKSGFLIRSNQVIINNPTDGANKGYLLTPDTGLLFRSKDLDVTMIEAPETKEVSREKRSFEEKTWRRQHLLNYRMGPEDVIQVQSRDLNGKFIIVSGTHKGSPTGTWVTETGFKVAGQENTVARKTNELYNLLANEKKIIQRIRCHDIIRMEDFDVIRMTVIIKPLVQREMAGAYVSPPSTLAVKVAYIPLEIEADGETADMNVQIKEGDIGVVACLDMDSGNSIRTKADSKPNTDRIHSEGDAVFVRVIRRG